MAVRLKDVAEYCGVSPGAVSQVIHGTRLNRIPERTRSKILAAVDELGYRPNNLSLGLRRKRSDLLSLIIPWNNPELMDTVEREAHKAGFKVMVNFTSSPDAEREIVNLDNALDWHVDGIIWLPFANVGYYPERLVKRLESSSTKIIFLQRKLKGIAGVLVGTDYRGGIRAAVKHCLEQKYDDILFAGVDSQFETKNLRKLYFQEALQEYGIAGKCLSVPNEKDIQEPLLAELNKLKGRATAVLCDNDWIALRFIEVARQCGLQVPGKVGIISIGDHMLGGNMRVSEISRPGLTSLRLDYSRQGTIATKYIAGAINEEKQEEDILLPLELIENQSTARIK